MKIRILLLSILVVLICCGSVCAAMTGECGDEATYSLVDKVLTIKGEGIVDIDDGWIDYYDVVETLIIDEGIVEIDSRMFDGFEVLSNVTFPETLTTIGARAFRDCISLGNLIIPDSVEDIAANSFAGCDNLVIVCSAGSYAEEYAIENSIEYKIISDVTITFDASGGEGEPDSLSGSMIETFTIPQQKPTRKGFVFIGWSDSISATEVRYQPGEVVMFSDNTTLYAVWLQCSFSDMSTESAVVIKSNATSPILDLCVAAYGENNRLLNVIIKPISLQQGDNRIEINADWDDTGRKFTKAFLWDKNLTPYAECKELLLTKSYKLVFEDWDGTVISNQSVLAGDDAVMPENPTREGYEFCGWSGNYTAVAGDATVIAQYVDASKKNVFKTYSAKGKKGDTVKLTVYLGGIVETCGFDMRLRYNKNALEFIKADGVLDLDAIVNHDSSTNTISFNYSAARNRTKSARVLEVEFKIKESAENSTTVYLSPIEIIRADPNQDNIPVDAEYTIENGVITID